MQTNNNELFINVFNNVCVIIYSNLSDAIDLFLNLFLILFIYLFFQNKT
jgi:hypothetical protein